MLSVASRFIKAFMIIVAGATSACAATPSVSPALKAELAPTGTLRAAINYNNPLLAKRDPATGELTGLAVDLSRELAKRAGLPLDLVPYDAAGKVSAAARSNQWDIAYLAIDPARAVDIEFTAAHSELEGTYLVPAGSKIQSIEEVDRPGMQVAVTAKSAYDLYLSRTLKHARIVHADNTPQSIDMLTTQKMDAVAAVKTVLVASAKQLPGSRVLNGHFMTIPQAAGVPKGRVAAARYVSEFIEEMKTNGFVSAAYKRHGIGPDDAIVAPPAAR